MFIKNNSSVPSETLILDDRIFFLINLYESKYKLSCKEKIAFIITDSIYEERLKISNEEERKRLERTKSEFENISGQCITLAEYDDIFYILIDKDRFLGSEVFIKTVFHEITHAEDFYNYMKLKNINSMINIMDNKSEYDCVSFYSEIRAYYRGEKEYWRIVAYDELGNFRSDIKNLHELCNYLKLYIYTAKKSLFVDNNYSEAQYHLAKFIGTYIAYKQMLNIIYEDDTFNVEWVHEIEEIIEDDYIFDNIKRIEPMWKDLKSFFK